MSEKNFNKARTECKYFVLKNQQQQQQQKPKKNRNNKKSVSAKLENCKIKKSKG